MSNSRIGWVYYVVASFGGRKLTPTLQKQTRLWTIWENLRLWLRLGNGVLCLAVMWVFLGLFTVYRQDVAKKMSGSDGDNDWTFGQVLALAQWVPVGIDLVVVYICELISSSLRLMPWLAKFSLLHSIAGVDCMSK